MSLSSLVVLPGSWLFFSRETVLFTRIVIVGRFGLPVEKTSCDFCGFIVIYFVFVQLVKLFIAVCNLVAEMFELLNMKVFRECQDLGVVEIVRNVYTV